MDKTEKMRKFRSELDKVEQLKKDGLSANAIAARYGIAACTVRRVVKEPFKHNYDGGERKNIDFEMTDLKKFALCGRW